jgi:hypothetical protein
MYNCNNIQIHIFKYTYVSLRYLVSLDNGRGQPKPVADKV